VKSLTSVLSNNKRNVVNEEKEKEKEKEKAKEKKKENEENFDYPLPSFRMRYVEDSASTCSTSRRSSMFDYSFYSDDVCDGSSTFYDDADMYELPIEFEWAKPNIHICKVLKTWNELETKIGQEVLTPGVLQLLHSAVVEWEGEEVTQDWLISRVDLLSHPLDKLLAEICLWVALMPQRLPKKLLVQLKSYFDGKLGYAMLIALVSYASFVAAKKIASFFKLPPSPPKKKEKEKEIDKQRRRNGERKSGRNSSRNNYKRVNRKHYERRSSDEKRQFKYKHLHRHQRHCKRKKKELDQKIQAEVDEEYVHIIGKEKEQKDDCEVSGGTKLRGNEEHVDIVDVKAGCHKENNDEKKKPQI